MKVLVVLLLLFYLVWVYIKYKSKLDLIDEKDKNLHIILWYNKYYSNCDIKRKYIILF